MKCGHQRVTAGRLGDCEPQIGLPGQVFFNPIVGRFPEKTIKVANEFVYDHKLTIRLLGFSFRKY